MSRVATPPQAKPVTPSVAAPVPREKIAMRAYEKWLKNGCQDGCDLQHWLEAETELKAETTRTGPHMAAAAAPAAAPARR